MIERVFCPFPKEAIQSKRKSWRTGRQLLQDAEQIVSACKPLSPTLCWRVFWRHVLLNMDLYMVNDTLTIDIIV
jgi:hypothetical protein